MSCLPGLATAARDAASCTGGLQAKEGEMRCVQTAVGHREATGTSDVSAAVSMLCRVAADRPSSSEAGVLWPSVPTGSVRARTLTVAVP